MPALYSHTRRPNITVDSAWQNGAWDLHLQNRLSRLATSDRAANTSTGPATSSDAKCRFGCKETWCFANPFHCCRCMSLCHELPPPRRNCYADLEVHGTTQVQTLSLASSPSSVAQQRASPPPTHCPDCKLPLLWPV